MRNMKTIIGLAAAFGLAAAATSAAAQASVPVTVNAEATLISPLAANANGTKLNFGTLVKPSNTSEVYVTPAGSRSVTAGNVALAGGTPTPAAFALTGEGSKLVNLTIPSTFTVTGPGGATMAVAPELSVPSLTLSAGGTGNFAVGGRLAMGSNQTTGVYTGNVDVTMVYN
jgi:spore coat protein U-like protein